MTIHQHFQDSRYFIPAESAAETARLTKQHRLLTEHMGAFPAKLDVTEIHRVLDLACGPGGWALDVAFHYPRTDVTGVDINKTNVQYAAARARSQGLENVDFEQMDITERLKFDEGIFDLVNARLLVGFMLPQDWPLLLAECMRILKPGGIACLTEAEWGITNSSAFEQYTALASLALKRAGQSFSPDGHHLGITPLLSGLLRQVGFVGIQYQAHAIDFSAQAEGYHVTCEDARIAFQLLQPFLLKQDVATQEELNEIYTQAVIDMYQETFCGIVYVLSVWAKKPTMTGPLIGDTEQIQNLGRF